MKKKFDGIVKHLGHDIQAGQIGVMNKATEDLFSELSGSQSPRTGKPDGNRQDMIIVAGKNLGWGICGNDLFVGLKKAGISAIIAESLSRDFYRGAINHGIAVIESPIAHERFSDGEVISIDMENGEIQSQHGIMKLDACPDIHYKIYLAGGLIPYTKKSLGK